MTENLTTLTVDELRKRHADLYRTLLPTLERYTQMATEALALQKEMYDRWLIDLDPQPETRDLALICAFSARETPATVQGILNGIQEKQIQVELAIYSALRQEYMLFGYVPQPARGKHQEVTNG